MSSVRFNTSDRISANNIYADISLNFETSPKSKDLLMIRDENAIRRSIKNLVLTNKYERFFAPEIGGNIVGLLFENLDTLTLSQIENHVEAVITNYEPRAKVLRVVATPELNNNAVTVTITFAILGAKKPLDIAILLERIR